MGDNVVTRFYDFLFFYRETTNENKCSSQKHEYLIQTWIRFTVVNRTLTSLHVGAFEITLTVPLSANKNKSRKSNC